MFDIDTKSDADSSAIFRQSALFAAMLAITSGGVWAQEKNSLLEEVIISASKRSETLQDTAILAVTVVSGDLMS
ncbi:MAG: outer membrane cobalamin receptor [Patiriisocius sp.]|jgi:outer membrane cobalamin receptor